jgi:pyruvate,water dikinase
MDAFTKGQAEVRPLLEEIATRLGLSYEQLIYLDCNEIERGLNEDELPDLGEIDSRQQEYATVRLDGEFKVLTGDEIDEVRAESTEGSVKSVQGNVAQEGTASGRARILEDSEELDRIQEGEIIVSPMTKPEMTPALERAAGIVTDEGGMLCHAAIVSRELGTPCVVGTGKATEVFEEGEKIEIMSNGNVQIQS